MTGRSKQQSPERHVVSLFAKRWENHDKYVLRCTVLAMLSGFPTRADAMEKEYSISKKRIAKAHATDRYDLDESGHVVDVFGVSTTERRPFLVSNNSSSLQVCCALVSMMVGLLAARPATIQSRDPVSGRDVIVAVNGLLPSASPESSVAVLVCPTEKEFCADQWNSFCRFVRMYEDESTVPADLNPAAILTIAQLGDLALELLQLLFGAESRSLSAS